MMGITTEAETDAGALLATTLREFRSRHFLADRLANGPFGLLAPPVVLHVVDQPAANPQGLVLRVLIVGTLHAPPERDHDPGIACGNHVGVGVGDEPPGLEIVSGNSMVENLTGLVGAVSTGGSSPPKVATRHAPPFEVGGEQGDEGLDVTTDRRVQRLLDPLSFGSTHAE